jgi:hypothetical protein
MVSVEVQVIRGETGERRPFHFGYNRDMPVVRPMCRWVLIVLGIFVALAVVALTLFWAIAPAITPVIALSDGNEADLIRELWPIRLVQPEWVFYFYGPSLTYWTLAESIARLVLVILGWLAAAFLIYRKYSRRQQGLASGAFEVIVKP